MISVILLLCALGSGVQAVTCVNYFSPDSQREWPDCFNYSLPCRFPSKPNLVYPLTTWCLLSGTYSFDIPTAFALYFIPKHPYPGLFGIGEVNITGTHSKK